MNTGKRYDEDFKKTIVDLYNSGNKTISELKCEYGLSNVSIYKWIKDYSPITTDDGNTTNNKEISQLKKGIS